MRLAVPAGPVRIGFGVATRKMPIRSTAWMPPTILLVDDNEALRTLASKLLQEQGFRVITAGDGEEALEIFQQQPHAISLLLTDIMMPKMNGLDLADRLRQLRPELPVLFISGNPEPGSRTLGYLAKPFTKTQLMSRVRQALETPG